MQGFVEFSEEKKITIKTKMGGEIPGTIKVTGKDYHIVKSDVGGKQYKTDHQGNALTEAEDDKDLPFTPDKKKTKPSTPGKYGDAYSTVRNLARKALARQKIKAVDEEVEQIEESGERKAFRMGMKHGAAGTKKINAEKSFGADAEAYHRGYDSGKEGAEWHATQADKAHKTGAYKEEVESIEERSEQSRQNKTKKNIMDASRGARFRQTTGVEMQPSDTGHKTAQQMNKALGRQLRREEIESELEKLQFQLQESYPQAHKVSVTVSDPNHQAISQRKEKIQKRVVVSATDKGNALAKAKKFYEKQGYKVHDVEHHSMVPKTTMKTEETALSEGMHRVAVWTTEPNHASTQKREYKTQKMMRVSASSPDEAEKKARAHFEGQGKYKVHKTAYHGSIKEDADLEEGYRGNSEADKPFFDAQDHKNAAVKAGNKDDNFSYHMHMASHHDSMAQWNSNKGRHHVADQHMNKAAQHEHDAQQYRKGAK